MTVRMNVEQALDLLDPVLSASMGAEWEERTRLWAEWEAKTGWTEAEIEAEIERRVYASFDA